jgi:endonuclease-8
MPEGDTLRRTADGLRPHLVGRAVLRATARPPGPRPELLVGRRIVAVEALGKNLLIRLEDGLAIRTHLGMHGTWHRYRPGEHWHRAPARARLVLEVEGAVAVCFDAPTVELLEQRAEPVHPPLASLGPDLLAPDADENEAVRRLRLPARADRTIAEGLLDQRALAGIGNVYKSEALFIDRIDPFAPVRSLGDAALRRLVATARRLLVANADRRTSRGRRTTGDDRAAAGSPLWVYGRAGRPCLRCGTPIASRRHGDPPRLTYWCPHCQAAAPGEAELGAAAIIPGHV